MIPLIGWIIWIKARSAVTCWVRLHSHPNRWLLATRLPKNSTAKALHSALRKVVEQARSVNWDAAHTLKRRDPESGEWIIGIISTTVPLDTETSASISFTEIPSTTVIRLSGESLHDDITQQSALQNWSKQQGITPARTVSALSAQSFQCWEWDLLGEPPVARTSPLPRLAEKIFEMRNIVLVPLILTFLSLSMVGTGSRWLFASGIFLTILLSGACKFVFLHQREDATQESHLQNY